MKDRTAYFAAYYQRNKEQIKARSAAYRAANPERARAAVRKWHSDPATAERREEYRKTYAETYRERRNARQRELHADPGRKAKRSADSKRWRTENPDKHAAKEGKRRAAKLRRTPGWLTDEQLWMLQEAYAIAARRSSATGIEWSVDHIVPLQGRNVSGLHVPWNVRVIPARCNSSKGNKFTEPPPGGFFL